MQSTIITPGTVSKILWHFTGGPPWDAKKKRQQNKPKDAPEAFDSLISILKTGELRLGNYKEIIRIDNPRFNQDSIPIEISSSPVCCLADVPIVHLSYLAGRYNKFAIGFHRDSIVKHGFNPVFYTLENTQNIRSLYHGYIRLYHVGFNEIRVNVNDTRDSVKSFLEEYKLKDEPDLTGLDNIEEIADTEEYGIKYTMKRIEDFFGLVKTFNVDEFNTVYCEREWRSLSAFKFNTDDIAMIVVPNVVNKRPYFSEFITMATGSLKLPRSIPIVPWEDLVEH